MRKFIRLHDRYLLHEIAGPLILWMAVVVMMKTLQELYSVIDQVTTGQFRLDTLGLYLLYKMPLMIQWSLPVAILLGSALAVSRLQHESELIAIRIAGVPLWRFLIPAAVLGLALSVASFVLGEWIAPAADHQAEAVHRKLTFEGQVSGLQQRGFFRSENRIFYFGASVPLGGDRTELRNIIIYQLNGVGNSEGEPDQLKAGQGSVFWTATQAEVSGDIWTLAGVIRHNVGGSGEITSDVPVPTMQINLHRDIQYFLVDQQTPQEMTARELRSRIQADEHLSLPASVVLPLRYEYAFRFALPFACLVFALIGAPMTLRFARGGSLVGILVAFGILFFYYDVMVIAQKLAVSGALAPEFAAWVSNFVFGAIGIYLILEEV